MFYCIPETVAFPHLSIKRIILSVCLISVSGLVSWLSLSALELCKQFLFKVKLEILQMIDPIILMLFGTWGKIQISYICPSLGHDIIEVLSAIDFDLD